MDRYINLYNYNRVIQNFFSFLGCAQQSGDVPQWSACLHFLRSTCGKCQMARGTVAQSETAACLDRSSSTSLSSRSTATRARRSLSSSFRRSRSSSSAQSRSSSCPQRSSYAWSLLAARASAFAGSRISTARSAFAAQALRSIVCIFILRVWEQCLSLRFKQKPWEIIKNPIFRVINIISLINKDLFDPKSLFSHVSL